MKRIISAKAKQELRIAAAWYEDQTKGLANKFLRAVDLSFGYIQRSLDTLVKVLPGIRHIGLRRFPLTCFIVCMTQKLSCWLVCTRIAIRKADPNIKSSGAE